MVSRWGKKSSLFPHRGDDARHHEAGICSGDPKERVEQSGLLG